MADSAILRNAFLSAEIAALGAELTTLRDTSGRDFLWNGDPAWWSGRSPLLFPIIGKVPGDQILVDGVHYPMRQHGLARISTFSLVETSTEACCFRLASSDETRAIYPFDFNLDIRYALRESALTIAATVSNTGDRRMPMSFGFHPAFRWPLPGGGAREAHHLIFDAPEPNPIRRLHNGGLAAQSFPSPVRGKVLPLADALFVEDALIFDQPVSRGVTFGTPGGSSLHVRYPAMPYLGVWTKPGAGFLCIEPWHGYAAPEGFDGELADKPGGIILQAGTSATFAIEIGVETHEKAA